MDLTVTENSYSTDDRTWLGSAHATDTADSVTLDCDLFPGTLGLTDGFIPSGTVLAKVTSGGSTGRYGPYDPDGTDGRQTAVGILLTGVRATAGRDVGAAMIRHGEIVEANLPHTGDGGIDAAGKVDLAGRMWFV